MPFEHEQLNVYELALDYIVQANRLLAAVPGGQGALGARLQHASVELVSRIAVAAGRQTSESKSEGFAQALDAVHESSSLIDVGRRLELVPAEEAHEAKLLLRRIGSMLSKLSRPAR